METARTALGMVLGIVLPLVLQLLDRSRMSAEERAGVWGYATWGGALYAFGPLSMLGWCWVTRPRWQRVWQGPAWTALLVLVMALFDAGFGGMLMGESDFGLLELLLACAGVALGGMVLMAISELCASVVPRRALERLVTVLAAAPFVGFVLAWAKVLLR